jgi:hypothetical protein
MVPPRNGISPVAVAGWAVALSTAEAGEWRKERPYFKRGKSCQKRRNPYTLTVRNLVTMPMDTHLNPPQARLPENLRHFFWSYRFEELETAKDEKTVIVQLINYGNLAHWRWLVRQYGIDEIRRVLQSIPASEIKPRTRTLASVLFSIPTWRNAHRGAH